MYDVISESGCKRWRVINVEPIGRALSFPEIMLDKSDYRFLFEFIKLHSQNRHVDIEYGYNYFLGWRYEYEVRSYPFLCQSGLKVM